MNVFVLIDRDEDQYETIRAVFATMALAKSSIPDAKWSTLGNDLVAWTDENIDGCRTIIEGYEVEGYEVRND